MKAVVEGSDTYKSNSMPSYPNGGPNCSSWTLDFQWRYSDGNAHHSPTARKGGASQVYSVNWNMRQRNLFLTGSWDDSIKLWDLNHPASLQTFREHTYCIYAAIW